jgi:hypothetical protein
MIFTGDGQPSPPVCHGIFWAATASVLFAETFCWLKHKAGL